jgi:hypothetical protein
VVVEWLEWGLEPGQLDSLTADEQRQFVADVFQADPAWTLDAFAEGFTRLPSKRVEIEQAFREGDFLQMGAVLDSVFRHYTIKTCEQFWESEFTQIQQQESDYTGDE